MVALFLRPDADQSDGSWLNESASATNLFASVDESTLSDTDYMVSSTTDGDKVRLRLSDPSGGVAAPLIVRYRCKRTGTQAANLIGRLYQGTAPGTLRATWTQLSVPDSFTTYTYTLTSAEFASITDFTDLYVEFELSQQSSLKVDLNFAGGVYYDSGTVADATGCLSCTRASTGYAKNADGTLTSFSSNALRIGVGTGLLIEDARKNWQRESQTFSTSWTADNTTVTVDQAVAPDGTTTMDQVSDGTNTSVHRVYLQETGLAAGVTRTISVFAKDVDRRYVQLIMVPSTASGAVYCYADLQTGTISDSGTAGTNATFTSASIEAFSGGVYRIILTGIPHPTDTGPYTMIALSDRSAQGGSIGGNFQPSYTGSSKSLYLWGAQQEEASFASSYIPTTNAAVTRAADSITCAGNLNTVLTAIPQTAVIDIDYNMVPSGGERLICSGSGFSGLYTSIDTFVKSQAGVSELNVQIGNSLTFSGGVKIGSAWATAARSLVGGGGTVGTATDAVTALSGTCHIGSDSAGGSYSFSYFRRIIVWNTKLVDATLQGYTAP